MIAGSVCAVLLIIGWSVALISYIVHRRKKTIRAKKVAAGVKPPKPKPPPPEMYIIPPDPAVVLGQRQPGERVVVESKHKNGRHAKRSKTMAEVQGFDGDGSEVTFPRRNTEPLSPHQENAEHPLTNGATT
jgi:cell division septation protein DedD